MSDHSNSGRYSTDRRKFLKVTGAAVPVAGLAGCLGGDDDGGGNGTGELDGPIKIGVLGNLDSPFGSDGLVGAEIARDEINADGGVLGADIEVVSRNSQDDPSTALEGYRELVLEEEVDVTTGLWLDGPMQNVVPEIAEQERLHFMWGAGPAMDEKLAEDYDSNKYNFRMLGNNEQAASARYQYMSDIFPDLGFDKVGFVFEDLGWNTGIEELVNERSGEDFEVVASERLSLDTSDFSPIWESMESADADAVYGFMAAIGANAVPQWAQQQRDFAMFGSIASLVNTNAWRDQNGLVANAAGNTLTIPGVPHNDLTVPFQETFLEEAERLPTLLGHVTYDCTRLYAEVIEETGTKDSDQLVEPLLNTEFQTTVGSLDFYGPDGEYPHNARQDPEHIIQQGYQWQERPSDTLSDEEVELFYGDQGGLQEAIWPPSAATAEYELPSWL